MTINEADVRKVARLAQLHVSDEEVGQLAEELNAIVSFVEQLNEVDVSGVEPVAQVSGMSGVMRADVAANMLPREVVLANAALHSDEAFLVPKAVSR